MKTCIYGNYGYALGMRWVWVYMGSSVSMGMGYGHGLWAWEGVWDITDDTPWITYHAGVFCFSFDSAVSLIGTLSSDYRTDLQVKTLR